MKETSLATVDNNGTKVTSFAPTSLSEAIDLSKIIAATNFVPKDYRNQPGNVLVAIQWGAELGIPPMQAIQNIAVINGRPAIYGDLALGLCISSHVCEYVDEIFDEETMTATCAVKRRGKGKHVVRFSQKDAEKAGLWKKAGPWTNYPKRMLQMRARGFALRDAFPDVLKGLITAEEAQDYPVNVQTNKSAPGAQNQPEKVSGVKALKNKLAKKRGEVIDAETEEVKKKNLDELKAEVDKIQMEDDLVSWYNDHVEMIDNLSEKDRAKIIENCGERKQQIIGEAEAIADQDGDAPDTIDCPQGGVVTHDICKECEDKKECEVC